MNPLLDSLELAPFRQRFPWLGPDLQTLRNTLRAPRPLPDSGQTVAFALAGDDRLLARFDPPWPGGPVGLVVVLHGLGGGSDDEWQRRLSRALRRQGFSVLRLNLRGAGPGRPLARGTYAACCNSDLLPVLRECRRLAAGRAPGGGDLPLGAVGLSLGGTVLLNVLLSRESREAPLLDGLVCISSPLDLESCAHRIDRPRNCLYQNWLVRRLIAQTLADPHGVVASERKALGGSNRPASIRAFDDLITAPRWGFPGVKAYYQACSPIHRLRQALLHLPPVLLVHAKDDPWVPVDPVLSLAEEIWRCRGSGTAGKGPLPEVLITARGGHNGFHAPGDSADGCWSDRLASLWLAQALVTRPGP